MIKAYLVIEHREKESYDTLVEIKRSKIEKGEEVAWQTNKKKALSYRNTILREGLASNRKQK